MSCSASSANYWGSAMVTMLSEYSIYLYRDRLEEAVSRITKSFEDQISKLIAERDAALLAVKHQRGKRFGGQSERNKGDNNHFNSGENRESEKSSYVDAGDQSQKEMEKAALESSNVRNGDTYFTR